MKIAIVSDLHFEINGYRIQSSQYEPADVLLIAGDLTSAPFFRPNRTDADARSGRKSLDKFIKEIVPKYKLVLYVAGNHEHYGSIFSETIPTLKNYLRDSGITLLDNESVEFEGIKFFGATLWTSFNKGDPLEMQTANYFMNDYNWIYRKSQYELTYEERHHSNRRIALGNILPMTTLTEHNAALLNLEDFLNKNKSVPVVILTHHAPSVQCHGRHRSFELMYSYVSDLEYIMNENPNIKLWAYGHTHDNMDFEVNNTRVVSNCQGYYTESGFKIFKPLTVLI